MKWPAAGLPLVLVWVFLWGEASIANLLSGTVVAAVLIAAFPSDSGSAPGRYIVRPLACAQLVGFFIVQLVKSNLELMFQTLNPSTRVHTAVLTCPLKTDSPRLITVIMNIMALTPGTMPIELDDDPETDPPVLYVHVLYTHDVEPIRRSIEKLQVRVVNAFASNSVTSDEVTSDRAQSR